jgi:hypothetical protein
MEIFDLDLDAYLNDREKPEPDDNADDKRDELIARAMDRIESDKLIIAKLIRNEFDAIYAKDSYSTFTKIEAMNELIGIATRLGYIEMAEQMANDMNTGGL